MTRNMLYISLAGAALLQVMFFLAIRHDLFWHLWWYDIPMHFLGGVVLGGLGIWLAGELQMWRGNAGVDATGLTVVFFVMCIGGAWEIFEYSTGNTFNTIGSYPLDIVKDLVMDLTGALAIFLYFRRKSLSA